MLFLFKGMHQGRMKREVTLIQIVEAFKSADTDNDRCISKSEMISLLESHGQTVTEDTRRGLDIIYKSFDWNKNYCLDLLSMCFDSDAIKS